MDFGILRKPEPTTRINGGVGMTGRTEEEKEIKVRDEAKVEGEGRSLKVIRKVLEGRDCSETN